MTQYGKKKGDFVGQNRYSLRHRGGMLYDQQLEPKFESRPLFWEDVIVLQNALFQWLPGWDDSGWVPDFEFEVTEPPPPGGTPGLKASGFFKRFENGATGHETLRR